MTIGVIEPTLLDLKDLVGATIGEVSFILMMNSIGSLIGCFFTGYLLDKLPHYKYLILSGDGILAPGILTVVMNYLKAV